MPVDLSPTAHENVWYELERMSLLERSGFIDKLFLRKKDARKMTIGIESEIYIVDEALRPLERESTLTEILDALPEQIWRDYYTYQLEIRTQPHKTIKDAMKDYDKLLHLARKECALKDLILLERGIYRGQCPNGIHLHIRFPKMIECAWEIAWASYPFVWGLAHFYKNSASGVNVGDRLSKSRHIGLIDESKSTFLTGKNKYKDFHYNKTKREERKRIKNVTTLECRIFDTVASPHLDTLVDCYYNLMSRIKPDIKLSKKFKTPHIIKEYANDMVLTRNGAIFNLYPFYKALNLTSADMYYLLSSFTKYNIPRYFIESDVFGTLENTNILDDALHRQRNDDFSKFIEKAEKRRAPQLFENKKFSIPMPDWLVYVNEDGETDGHFCNCSDCSDDRKNQIEKMLKAKQIMRRT